MKDILITISACNRRELTLRSFKSVAENKSEHSVVLVIDDHSTTWRLEEAASFGFCVMRTPSRFGVGRVGEVFRFAYRTSLEFGLPYICSLPNDVLVAKHFDSRTLDIHRRHAGPRDCVCGYRSIFHPASEVMTDCAVTHSSPGNCLLVNRATMARILAEMPYPGEWDMLYDHKFTQLFDRILVPVRSLIQHTGIHQHDADTVHQNGGDSAVDFVGEGQ